METMRECLHVLCDRFGMPAYHFQALLERCTGKVLLPEVFDLDIQHRQLLANVVMKFTCDVLTFFLLRLEGASSKCPDGFVGSALIGFVDPNADVAQEFSIRREAWNAGIEEPP